MKILFALFVSISAFGATDTVSSIPNYSWIAYPSMGYASITGNSSGCTINRLRATNDTAWVTCTRTALGTYALTFASGFFTINPPICIATVYGTPLAFSMTDPTLSGTTVTLVTLLNIGADGTFAISCR